jgi:hypothetical protein
MHTVINYDLPMETISQPEWITQCAERLHQRWHTVDTAQLEEVAVVIWQDAKLRHMAPADAAALWLKPVVPGMGGA